MPNNKPLKIRNPKLYKAIFKYTIEAITQLAKPNSTDITTKKIPAYIWEPTDSASIFTLKHQEKNITFIRNHLYTEKIELNSLHKIAEDEIQSDQIWSIHFNKLVGSTLSLRSILKDDFFIGIIQDCLSAEDSKHDIIKFINSLIEKYETAFSSQTIEYTRKTPILGIELTKPITVSEQIVIRPLQDQEIADNLEYGLSGADFINFRARIAKRPCKTAIVTRFSTPKIIRNEEEITSNKHSAEELRNNITDRERLLIDILSLVVENKIMPTGHLEQSNNPLSIGMHIRYENVSNALSPKNIKLSNQHDTLIHSTWEIFINKIYTNKNRQNLAIALHRYAMAMSSTSIDDKIIDLMTSAEALFLEDPHELSYKLATRAAIFIGKDEEQRKHIYGLFKKAYDLRSKIVHGKERIYHDHRDHRKHSIELDKIFSYMRSAILKMIEIANKASAEEKKLIDWEDLLFKNYRSS